MTVKEIVRVRDLFLEERIAFARRALNEHSMVFMDSMSPQMKREFHQYIQNVLTILDGDPFGDMREKFK